MKLSLLFLSSIYLPLFLFSLFYELIVPDHKVNIIEKKRSIKDKELRIESVKNGNNPTFYPQTIRKHFGNTNFYPIGSLPNKKSFLCNEGYGLVTYKTDIFGLRNKAETWKRITKKDNIILLGDSFIHGSCVDDENTIASVISKNKKFNVLNLGMGGNGPHEYIATLKTLVKPIINQSTKSSTVLLIFYANDDKNYPPKLRKYLSELIQKARPIVSFNKDGDAFSDEMYLKILKAKILKNYPLNKEQVIDRINNRKISKYSLKTLLKKIITLRKLRIHLKLAGPNKFNFKENMPNKMQYSDNSPSAEAIEYLSDICKSPCRPFVGFIPNSNYWRPDRVNRMSKVKNEYLDHLIKHSNINKVPFLNFKNIIDQNDKSNYAPKGPHLSILGNKRIGEFISSEINIGN